MILFPNAKINIGLNIVEKRNDGYHNIETVFYPVGLCDILEITEDTSLKNGECRFSVTGIPVPGNTDDNLVIKAYHLLNSRFALPGVSVYLHKIIPMGAGLGGGSSDAAFMLKGLNTLFNTGMNDDELEQEAARIGSDCPFFIKNMPVFAYERGNQFSDILFSLRGYYLLIVKPDIHVGTKEAYSSITPALPGVKLSQLVELPLEQWKELIINDFERSVFQKYPEIETIKNNLYRMGAVYASMSGSGSAVYGLFHEMPESTGEMQGYFTWGSKL
ncbi:MAG: 4-(cytidine 5'-diphospho)-2-C-methyl-D-erythritol kinase [Bacteroidales bacterium]|nr:4-(cytidine 5'-diphospho)-2-C-methyl-D-erythritol kinase [Bacteroidales bacterium]